MYQDYGYAKRGKKIYGSRTGKRTARENLIAARQGRELLAPMSLEGSVNGMGFEKWLEQWLMPELRPNSTLILDNAPTNFVRPRAKLWTQQMLCIVRTESKKLLKLEDTKCYFCPDTLQILTPSSMILLP